MNALARWLLMLVVIVVAATGAVYYLTSDDDHIVTGSLVLTDAAHIYELGRYCEGIGEYDVLRRDALVRIWDASGHVIASGALATGVQVDSTCVFSFRFDDVPDVDQYHVQFGDHPVFVIERSQFEQSGWTATINVDE